MYCALLPSPQHVYDTYSIYLSHIYFHPCFVLYCTLLPPPQLSCTTVVTSVGMTARAVLVKVLTTDVATAKPTVS